MNEMSQGGSSCAGVMYRELRRAVYIWSIIFSIQLFTHCAEAEPVLGSSLGFCKDVPVLKAAPLRCCLPAPVRKPVKFKFPKRPSGGPTLMRERKPAHVLQNDPEYVRKYNLAYVRMKALPDSDPRSFLNQWRIHCSFCNEAFKQRSTEGPLGEGPEAGVFLQVHFSWTFLPWHRMYLYYHERILADLIDDPTFALPFWNWDNQLDEEAAMIPFMYLPNFGVNNSALLDPNKNPNHLPPKILHLGYNPGLEKKGKQNLTEEQIRFENLCVMYNTVATKVSARDFLGGPYVVGTNNTFGTVNATAGEFPGEPGGLETLHNIPHQWTGFINDPNHPNNEDMGNFIFAAQDPIFYSHHANIDRLWDVWRTLRDKVTRAGNRKRVDYASKDFLDTEFTFFDENQDMVVVKSRDSLDISKLGYKYTDVSESDNLWINYEPLHAHNSAKAWKTSDYPAAVPSGNNLIGKESVSYRMDRRSPTKRDLKGKGVKHVNQLQESIVLEKVKIPHSGYARFDVFINYPEANRETRLYMSEYVGTFTLLPSGMNMSTSVSVSSNEDSSSMFRTFTIRFSADQALRRLGISDWTTDVIVTIVSKVTRESSSTNDFSFSNIKQDFQ